MLGCAVVALLLASACGKKADPLLPVRVAPEQVKRLQAAVRSGAIILAWKAPSKNTDNSPLLDLAGFKIHREELPVAKVCPRCPRNFVEFFDYPYQGARDREPQKDWFVYYDRTVEPGHHYSYVIYAYNQRETRGPASTQLSHVYDVPPAAPQQVRAERDNRLISIVWEATRQLEDGRPGQVAGYNLYRSLTGAEEAQTPLNRELIMGPAAEDIPEAYDRTYYYTVRAVRRVQDTLIESRPSEEVVVRYMDITAPGAPQALTAIAREDGIMLKWMPKAEQDFAGFNLYRKGPSDTGFMRLNNQLITQSSWLDQTVQARKRYAYAVTAVDRSAQANESPYSETVEILYLLK